MQAALRRETIVAAAATEFALHGLHGASTVRIAQRAGISHAYVFRFFPTKRDLFLSACGLHLDRLDRGEDDREARHGLIQALAAVTDPEVGAAVRPRLLRLFAERGPALVDAIHVDLHLEAPKPCSPA